jgi:hypothetical protein
VIGMKLDIFVENAIIIHLFLNIGLKRNAQLKLPALVRLSNCRACRRLWKKA